MTRFVVHNAPGSPYGRAVLITLIEKGAPFVHEPIKGPARADPHLQRHPFGRIPVLDDGDFRVYETQAILRYLDRVAPSPPLTPKDPKAAARMDQLMNICDWYLFQGVCNVIAFWRLVAPRLLGLDPDEAAIAEAMPRAGVVIGELERMLGDQPWLAGDSLSLADLLVGPHLDFLAMTPEWATLSQGAPALCALLERLRARKSFVDTTWEALTAADAGAPAPVG